MLFRSDRIVEFAEAHGQRVRGHTLVWHRQNPAWLTGGTFTRDELIAVLHDHIATLVGRYLTVSRSATPTASDPISWDEVIGITVRTPAGEVIGEIIDCYRAGGAEVYMVRTSEGAELDLPAVASVITTFDPRAGVIVADLTAMDIEPRQIGRAHV